MRTGDAYAFTPLSSENLQQSFNGLNQVTIVTTPSSVTVVGSDALGNLSTDPISGNSFTYDLENKLTSAVAGGVTRTLSYDPLNRLNVYNPGASRRFVYDGAQTAAELDSAGAIQDRYVSGDGTDEVLVDYVGSGTTSRRFLSGDERGSVISLTDSSGGLLGINTYDEYGKPGAANIGRFQYTGQKWIGEIGAYDYKARVYLPHLGVFAQTDPIGQVDSPNLYAYVLDDPINATDPFGLDKAITCRNQPGCGGGVFPVTPIGGPLTQPFPAVIGANPDTFSTPLGDGYYDSSGAFHYTYLDAASFSWMFQSAGSGRVGGTQSSGQQQQQSVDELVITGFRHDRFGGIPINWYLADFYEQRWAIYPGGRTVYLGIAKGEPRGDTVPIHTIVGLDIMALVHTHPFWSFDYPGAGDYGHNIPIYGLTPTGAWVVQPGARAGNFTWITN